MTLFIAKLTCFLKTEDQAPGGSRNRQPQGLTGMARARAQQRRLHDSKAGAARAASATGAKLPFYKRFAWKLNRNISDRKELKIKN